MKKIMLTIIFILIIIALLALITILTFEGIILHNKITGNNQTENSTDNDIKYPVYKIGEEITLADDSKWLVIENSDATQDYVTVLGQEDYTSKLQGDMYDKVLDDLYSTKTEYKDSNIDKFMSSFESKMPAKLKEVDGYKIRLITLEEIMSVDNNWVLDEFGSYDYNGEKPNDYISNILTMTPIDPKSAGKQWAFYIAKSSYVYDENGNMIDNVRYFITNYSVGVSGLKPVINVYKSELKK